jgi:glycosyltransferase involved in cell wall biosynthesis
MRVAFYAPLKPPDHPVPSGDRRVSRLLMQALRLGGHEPVLVSRFRSRDAVGDRMRQARLAELGQKMALRVLRQWHGPEPDIWLTYHLYYKAPDWIGPHAARVWQIPYVIAEASYAPKRAGGPWELGHQAVAAAVRNAATVLCLNPNDKACLEQLAPRRLDDLAPFLDPRAIMTATKDRQRLARAHGLDPREPWLLAVGMMREGDKLESYRVLAKAMALLDNDPWQLLIAGDGVAAKEVQQMFQPFKARVAWLGQLDEAVLADVYKSCDLLVWPAMREAFGMALLEAQAAGLPVVAGRTDGVPAIVLDGRTGLLPAPGNAGEFAQAVRSLLTAPARREAMGKAAREHVLRHHSIRTAAATLDRIMRELQCRS